MTGKTLSSLHCEIHVNVSGGLRQSNSDIGITRDSIRVHRNAFTIRYGYGVRVILIVLGSFSRSKLVSISKT